MEKNNKASREKLGRRDRHSKQVSMRKKGKRKTGWENVRTRERIEQDKGKLKKNNKSSKKALKRRKMRTKE